MPERKCTCVSHIILRSRTLVPLQATIRLPRVHGGLGRIDLDQGLADTPGATYASELDAAMMAGATQLSFWWRRSTLGSLLAIRLMQELAEETTGHQAAVPELTKQRTSQPKSKWRECHGRKSRLCCDAIPDP